MNAWMESIGGLGLFLLGMSMMSSGLRHLAGERLHRWLEHSTRNAFTGACTGAVTTALVQSSSATTVAAVGFVGAGLLTFTQSLGIIFGANIGTTMTGWMVALLGFELDLKSASLPLIFVAAVCYLFKRMPKLRGTGKALAGFCLIFLGIGYLQSGLMHYRDAVDLGAWQASDFTGRFVLVFAGILLTLITQSSSATVAIALTALNSHILSVPQAAAVVIGADIGTTATAALATIGGSTAARRTGFAHVVYNLLTGLLAFLILPIYLGLISAISPDGMNTPELVVVGFHSSFNTLGVILILPFSRSFGKLIERIIPESPHVIPVLFDHKLLLDSTTASNTLAAGSRKLASKTIDHLTNLLEGEDEGDPTFAEEDIIKSINDGRRFAVELGRSGEENILSNKIFASLHLLDHVERLAERSKDRKRLRTLLKQQEFKESIWKFTHSMAMLASDLESDTRNFSSLPALSSIANDAEEDKSRFRHDAITAGAAGKIPSDELDEMLDAHRWFRRVSYNTWRIAYYASELANAK